MVGNNHGPGKPHPEQGLIGVIRVPNLTWVGRLTLLVTIRLDRWSSVVQIG